MRGEPIRSASAASRLLGCVALQSYFLSLTLHSLHLVRSRARKVDHAATMLPYSSVVRACGLFSGTKAAKIGLHMSEFDICFELLNLSKERDSFKLRLNTTCIFQRAAP